MRKLLVIAIVLSLSQYSCTTKVPKDCSRCDGNGKIEVKETCSSCKGRGKTRCTFSTVYKEDIMWGLGGSLTYSYHCEGGRLAGSVTRSGEICPKCNGSALEDCSTCQGYGYKKKKKSCSSCGGDGTVYHEVYVWETW